MTPGFAKTRQELPWLYYPEADRVIINAHNFGGQSLDLTGLVSWWSLDEASGTRVDSHGSNDLTDDSAVGSTVGKVGDAANLVSASTDSLSHADNADLRLSGTDASIAFWVKLSANANDHVYVSKWDNGNNLEFGVQYRQPADRFRFAVGNGASNFVVAANTFGAVPTGVWYFIACSIDNTDKKISIAINQSGWDESTFSGTISAGANPFYVGRRSAAATPDYADAAIDEISIWKRKLTADEWETLYNSGNGIAYPG